MVCKFRKKNNPIVAVLITELTVQVIHYYLFIKGEHFTGLEKPGCLAL